MSRTVFVSVAGRTIAGAPLELPDQDQGNGYRVVAVDCVFTGIGSVVFPEVQICQRSGSRPVIASGFVESANTDFRATFATGLELGSFASTVPFRTGPIPPVVVTKNEVVQLVLNDAVAVELVSGVMWTVEVL